MNLLNTFLISKEIEKGIKMVDYFTRHLIRCKKPKDKAKITALIVVNLSFIAELVILMRIENKKLINNLLH